MQAGVSGFERSLAEPEASGWAALLGGFFLRL